MKLPDYPYLDPHNPSQRDFTDEQEELVEKALNVIVSAVAPNGYWDGFTLCEAQAVEWILGDYLLRGEREFESLGQLRTLSKKALKDTNKCLKTLKEYDKSPTLNVLLSQVANDVESPIFLKDQCWYSFHENNIDFRTFDALLLCLTQMDELLQSKPSFRNSLKDTELIINLCPYLVELKKESKNSISPTEKRAEWQFEGPLYEVLEKVMAIMGGDSTRKVIGNILRNHVDWKKLES